MHLDKSRMFHVNFCSFELLNSYVYSTEFFLEPYYSTDFFFFFCKFQDIGMDVEVTDKINTISCDSLTSVVTLLTNSFVTLHCNLIEFRKNSIVP